MRAASAKQVVADDVEVVGGDKPRRFLLGPSIEAVLTLPSLSHKASLGSPR